MALIIFPCGLGLAVSIVVILVGWSERSQVEVGDVAPTLAGAVPGAVILILARRGLNAILQPDPVAGDGLYYYVLPPFFGSFLGAATVLIRRLRAADWLAAARNVLLVISLVVFPLFGLGLYARLFHPNELITSSGRSTLFGMSGTLLPALWVVGLWMWQGFWTRRPVRYKDSGF